ncbi:hypothetical protein HanXRQr2_Chr15g0704091 [Helianthus annuus]|uniref:Uncharacterized protein n=1 Tax=Helianthus annuus TaxID=4232 RepID=A0A251UZI1_HELAN|nr:hypothetical protein HanXRQr2_Chr15g0704091 [Helianthus annuus]
MNRVSIEFKVFLKKKSKVVFTLQLPPWPSCQWDEVVSVTLWDEYAEDMLTFCALSLRLVKHSLCCAHGPHGLR